MSFYRDFEDVIDALILAKEEKRNVNLLIGAGCSVSAGIPSATGIVDDIKSKYPREYNRIDVKNYANCMSRLTPTERKNLIMDYVENAKINWAHLGIAQLLREGYVNRILTTNFDNLAMKACSLVGEFPAVYDLATSKSFKPDLLFDKSVVHLHGQHTGFILCNTTEEVENQAQVLRGVFDDLKHNSLWIVVGYSGQNDPVFKLLCEESVFEHRLFWIGHNDAEPSEELAQKLLDESKYAFYVEGYDADRFFVNASRSCDCFPPDFVVRPFTHLQRNLDQLTPYELSADEVGLQLGDLNISARNVLSEAVQKIENDKVLMAEHYLRIGLHDQFANLMTECDEDDRKILNKKFRHVLSDTVAAWEQQCLIYETGLREAMDTKSRTEVLEPWIRTLGRMATYSSGDKAVEYLKIATEKCDELLTVEPNNVDYLCLAAHVFRDYATELGGEPESVEFLTKGIEACQNAHRQDPGDITALLILASIQHLMALWSDDNQELWIEKEIETFNLVGDQGRTDIMFSWANALYMLAQFKEDADRHRAIDLYKDAYTKINEIHGDLTDFVYVLRAFISQAYARSYFEYNGPKPHSRELVLDSISASKTAYIASRDGALIRTWTDSIKILFDFLGTDIECNVEEHCNDFILAVSRDGDNIPDLNPLNGLAYDLIDHGIAFGLSRELIDFGLTLRADDPFLNATMGMWYLKNIDEDVVECESKGIELYSHAIELVHLDDQMDDELARAFTQKYLLELARFSYFRKGDYVHAKQCCTQAFEFGEFEIAPGNYKDVQQLMTSLETRVDDSVAVTIDKGILH